MSNTFENTPQNEQSQPARKTSRLALAGFTLVTVALISSLIGAIVGVFVFPYIFGLQPLKFYKGAYFARFTPDSQKTIIQTKEEGTVVAVAEKVQPSVVNIRTQSVIGDVFNPQRTVEGVGSGVIFRKDGYVLTNNHVVQDADEIFVTIPGRPDSRGRVVGRDPETDLAVVKIDGTGLPVAELGSSDQLKVGETVVAVGSPFSFEQTVTSGIVSALNRNVSTSPDQSDQSVTLTNLIQTDAAINPGNSGGALANSRGQVIGINALIISRSGGNQGIGFAIPIDLARKVANQLTKEGKATHAYLGVLGQTLDQEYARTQELETTKGAIMVEVVSDGPAGKAGLRKSDIVVSFGDEPIESMEDLIAAIRKSDVGEKIKITFVRDGKKQSIEVVLAEKPRSIENP